MRFTKICFFNTCLVIFFLFLIEDNFLTCFINGDIGDTRKDLIKVRKKVDSNWEEYSEEEEEIIDYFDELYEKNDGWLNCSFAKDL